MLPVTKTECVHHRIVLCRENCNPKPQLAFNYQGLVKLMGGISRLRMPLRTGTCALADARPKNSMICLTMQIVS